LFWAAESVVLFWLYQRSRISLVKIASLAITLLMFISLLMDWSHAYFSSVQVLLLQNRGFITSITAAASLFIYYWLMRKEADSFYINETNQ
jgi:hypothetical protein